ncbi:MAG: class II aldolase/adducin family protein [Lautropia sp.]
MIARAADGFACEDDARRALIDAAIAMNDAGINQGKAGNVSLRWPRSAREGFLVTPSALPYSRTGVDDVVWVGFGDRGAGREPVFDGARKPSSEWRFHHDILLARPATGCVLHTHGVHSATLACRAKVQREGMPAFHYMIAVAGGDSIRCAPYATFGTQALSDHAIAALEDRRACLLANHGLIATGAGLDDALALALEVETLARMYGRLLDTGDAVILGDAQMREVLERFGTYRP